MALRADCEVEGLTLGRLDEAGDGSGVQVEVRVDERDPVAGGSESPRLPGVALAEIAVVMDHADARLAAGNEQTLGGIVDRAVRHSADRDFLAVQGTRGWRL